MSNRPQCTVEGCTNPAHIINKNNSGGYYYRKVCGVHHTKTWHPSLKYRKDYCENIDGRLGFKCTTTINWSGMLDVDHINGMPNDNREENFQTLCKCCHSFKTHINKDYATDGRKKLQCR